MAADRDIPEEMVERAARAAFDALKTGVFESWSFDELGVHRHHQERWRTTARAILSAALAGRQVVDLPAEPAEQQWQVTVSVPMRLDGEDRQELFDTVVAAVAAWEPDDRDGWDADVYGNPAPPPGLADQLHEWAGVLTRGSGMVPAVDVAWKLRQLADGRAAGSGSGEG